MQKSNRKPHSEQAIEKMIQLSLKLIIIIVIRFSPVQDLQTIWIDIKTLIEFFKPEKDYLSIRRKQTVEGKTITK